MAIRILQRYYEGGGVSAGKPGAASSGGKAGTHVRPIRGIRAVLRVPRAEVPYWEQRGWEFSGGVYQGSYRTRFGEWAGEMQPGNWTSDSYYILSPPAELKEHRHWLCFRHKGDGRYLVHFNIQPQDLSAGILAIEQILSEAGARSEERRTRVVRISELMPAPMAPTLRFDPAHYLLDFRRTNYGVTTPEYLEIGLPSARSSRAGSLFSSSTGLDSLRRKLGLDTDNT